MQLEQYSKRMKNVFVLYVNIFPYIIEKETPLFLLMRRNGEVVMDNVWQPVSGKIKEEESIKESFFRQVRIKTGQNDFKIFRADKVHFYYDDYYDCVMSVPFASSLMNDKQVQIDTKLHNEYKWVGLEEFNTLNPFEAHRSFAKQIHAFVCEGKNDGGFKEISL